MLWYVVALQLYILMDDDDKEEAGGPQGLLHDRSDDDNDLLLSPHARRVVYNVPIQKEGTSMAAWSR